MGSVLAKHVELTLEVTLVERASLADRAIAVVRLQDDEGLKDGRLLAACSGAEDRPISRDLTPAEDTQTKVDGDAGERRLLALQLDGVVRLEEDVAHGVFAGVGELAAEIALRLPDKELVRDASHDARAIAIAAVCARGSAMGHRTKELARIGYDFVGRLTADVTDEADTAGVLLIVVEVETLVRGEGSVEGVRVALYSVEAGDVFGRSMVGDDGEGFWVVGGAGRDGRFDYGHRRTGSGCGGGRLLLLALDDELAGGGDGGRKQAA